MYLETVLLEISSLCDYTLQFLLVVKSVTVLMVVAMETTRGVELENPKNSTAYV